MWNICCPFAQNDRDEENPLLRRNEIHEEILENSKKIINNTENNGRILNDFSGKLDDMSYFAKFREDFGELEERNKVLEDEKNILSGKIDQLEKEHLEKKENEKNSEFSQVAISLQAKREEEMMELKKQVEFVQQQNEMKDGNINKLKENLSNLEKERMEFMHRQSSDEIRIQDILASRSSIEEELEKLKKKERGGDLVEWKLKEEWDGLEDIYESLMEDYQLIGDEFISKDNEEYDSKVLEFVELMKAIFNSSKKLVHDYEVLSSNYIDSVKRLTNPFFGIKREVTEEELKKKIITESVVTSSFENKFYEENSFHPEFEGNFDFKKNLQVYRKMKDFTWRFSRILYEMKIRSTLHYHAFFEKPSFFDSDMYEIEKFEDGPKEGGDNYEVVFPGYYENDKVSEKAIVVRM